MLEIRRVARSAMFTIADVHCWHPPNGWSTPEVAVGNTLVVPRRGTFRRRVDGRSHVVEPNVAYFERAGEEQQVMHPQRDGDRCLSVLFAVDLVIEELPEAPFATSGSMDVRARVLLVEAAHATHADELEETVVMLLAEALAAGREAARRPRALPSRHRLAATTREVLAADPRCGIVAIAAPLGCSPDHLSRAFRQSEGTTFTAYRRRIRVRAALERIGDGEIDLARVAADCGFADHAHMTRSIRAEAGATPSQLRQSLV